MRARWPGRLSCFFGRFAGGDAGAGAGAVAWGCRTLALFSGDEVASVEGLGEVGLVVVSHDGRGDG